MSPFIIDGQSRSNTSPWEQEHDEWEPTGYYVPHFKRRVEEQLARLEALPANWDRGGAPQISRAVIAAVRQFVDQLPENLAQVPTVVPISRGNVQLEWNQGEQSLELEFESPTTIRFLKWNPEAGVEEEDAFPASDIQRAEALIRWFLRGQRSGRS